MIKNRKQQIDYTLFLPLVAALVREKKEDKDTQLTDAEFKAMVAILYRDAVIEFAKDSELFRVDIPIDIYAGVRRYEIIPPEGYFIQSIIRLRTGRRNVPKNYIYDDNAIVFDNSCCPKCDVDEAFFAEVSIVPRITDNKCLFDADFVNRYYDIIALGIQKRLYAMMNRSWFNGQMSALREQQYREAVDRAIADKHRSGGPSRTVKLRYRRISDAMCG